MTLESSHNIKVRNHTFLNANLDKYAKLLSTYVVGYDMKGLFYEGDPSTSKWSFSQHVEILNTSIDLLVAADMEIKMNNLIAFMAIVKTFVEYVLKYSFMLSHEYSEDSKKIFENFHTLSNIELYRLVDKVNANLASTQLESFVIDNKSLDILNDYTHLNNIRVIVEHLDFANKKISSPLVFNKLIEIIEMIINLMLASTIIYKYFYLTSSDYIDLLESGINPNNIDGKQYIVAPWFEDFIQTHPTWKGILPSITKSDDENNVVFKPPFMK